MEIYQLRTFVTVAKVGSLTKASEILHVTQPAITAQLKALEEELGVALFDRRPGRVTVTKTGETLLPHVEKALRECSEVLREASRLAGQVTGRLAIGTVGDPESLRLGRFLGGLMQALPQVEIKTRSGQAEELLDAVLSGGLNAAFHVGPRVPGGVCALALQTSYYRIAGPGSWRDRIVCAGWKDIAGMPWIGAHAKSHIYSLTNDLFSNQGLRPNVVIESDEVQSLPSLVRAGVGLTLMREDVAVADGERGDIVLWPHAQVAARTSFVYQDNAESDPAIVGAVAVLKSVWGLAG